MRISRNYYISGFIFLIIILIVVSFLNGFSNNFLGRASQKFLRIVKKPVPVTVVYQPEETIKILEGWTNQDIVEYLVERGQGTNEELFLQIGKGLVDDKNNPSQALSVDWVAKFSFLADKPKEASLEGYLFPDTYRIFASTTPEAIIQKMLENFEAKLNREMRAEIKRQGKTIYEILTLASIVEKEAPIYNNDVTDNYDARFIAGIFWDRLKIGQALQSDATLSYLLQDNNPRHSGADLEIDSPYNTYEYRGLPPGPICNPGLAAIQAAIYPLYTEYNYFLTPTDTRTVIYARTYADHLVNKNKYLK